MKCTYRLKFDHYQIIPVQCRLENNTVAVNGGVSVTRRLDAAGMRIVTARQMNLNPGFIIVLTIGGGVKKQARQQTALTAAETYIKQKNGQREVQNHCQIHTTTTGSKDCFTVFRSL